MTIRLKPGTFYDFYRSRPTNRPGAPLKLSEHSEIGSEIAEPAARRQVQNGKDVYTPNRTDAFRLASSAYSGVPPKWDGAHQATYFPHYHPGDEHTEEWKRAASAGRPISADAPGHVYWGNRGELLGQKQQR
jgi:hypothetical protein